MSEAKARLRAWRKSKGLTQEQAAELLGLKWQGTWAAWEAGHRRPSIEQLAKIDELTKGRHRVRPEDWVETDEEREERRRRRAG